MTGGLPEAVEMSINNQNRFLLNTVYNKVSDTYKKEISTLDTLIDITRGLEVYDSIPYQLQKPNRKFQYGLIKSGSRSKDYEKSINFLHTNGFAYKCYKISDAQIPLSGCRDPESFKMYLKEFLGNSNAKSSYLSKSLILLINSLKKFVFFLTFSDILVTSPIFYLLPLFL
jgi:hypothetical protein